MRGLLDELGLNYSEEVAKICRITKGMVICDMTSKVDTKTSFNIKMARPNSRDDALLAAQRVITGQERRKYFPGKLESNQKLCEKKQTLVDYCKLAKRPEPLLVSLISSNY